MPGTPENPKRFIVMVDSAVWDTTIECTIKAATKAGAVCRAMGLLKAKERSTFETVSAMTEEEFGRRYPRRYRSWMEEQDSPLHNGEFVTTGEAAIRTEAEADT